MTTKSIDVDFMTLRNVTAYNPNNTFVPPGFLAITGANGKLGWTSTLSSINISSFTINNLEVSSLIASTIVSEQITTTDLSVINLAVVNGSFTTLLVSDLTAESLNISTIQTDTISTNSIQFENSSILTTIGDDLYYGGKQLNLWDTSGTNIYNINSGNVGIGTNNPSGLLDVHGVLSITGNNDGDSKLSLFNNKMQIYTHPIFNGCYFQNKDDMSRFYFLGQNTSRYYVSIGPPQYPSIGVLNVNGLLTINGIYDGDSMLSLFNNKMVISTNTNFNGCYFNIKDTINRFYFTGPNISSVYASIGPGTSTLNVNGLTTITSGGIDICGNFLYKATNPTNTSNFKLELTGSNLNVYKSTIGTVPATCMANTGGGQLVLTTNNNVVFVNGESKGNNNVGIGTNDPQATLDVHGKITITGDTDGDSQLVLFNDKMLIGTNPTFDGCYFEILDNTNRFYFTNSESVTTYASIGPGTNQLEVIGGASVSGTLSTDVIDMSGGAINGLSTINGLPYPPPQNYMPVGSIVMYSAETAPPGWVLCDNSSYDNTDSTYTALFNVIGYTYGGTGNTFFVPDLKQRFPMGYKSGTNNPGDTGGASQVTLNISNIPDHTHALQLPKYYNASTGSGVDYVGLAPVNTGDDVDNTKGVNTTTNTGTPFDILPPYIVVNYIIKL